MKNSRQTFGWLTLFYLFIYLSGCRQTGCTDPEALNFDPNAKKDCTDCCLYPTISSEMDLYIRFHWMNGEEPVQYGSYQLVNDSLKLNFELTKIYLSNWEVKSPGLPIGLDSIVILDNGSSEDHLLLKATKMEVSEISFRCGLGTENHKYPAEFPVNHPLGVSESGMFWNVMDGRVHLLLQGMADTSANPLQPKPVLFRYQVNMPEPPVEFLFSRNDPFFFPGKGVLHFKIDVARLLQNFPLKKHCILASPQDPAYAAIDSLKNNLPFSLSWMNAP